MNVYLLSLVDCSKKTDYYIINIKKYYIIRIILIIKNS